MDGSSLNTPFSGRWVLVSGASSGIGRAIAVELAAQGAAVILTGRNQEQLQASAAALRGAAHRVLVLDLTNVPAIVPAVQQLRADVGPIYGLCHAAGIVTTRPLAANTAEVVRAQLEINVVAGLELARAVCRRDVLSPDGGSLLFVSSVYGRVGIAGQVGYCATKGAVASAARALAVELARRNVRANSLSPGLVFTDMTERALGMLSSEHVEKLKAAHPLGPGQAQDVAHAAAFLLAPASRWITGVDLAVDGGFTAQ